VLNDVTNINDSTIDLRGKKELKLVNLNTLKIPLQDGKLWKKRMLKSWMFVLRIPISVNNSKTG